MEGFRVLERVLNEPANRPWAATEARSTGWATSRDCREAGSTRGCWRSIRRIREPFSATGRQRVPGGDRKAR